MRRTTKKQRAKLEDGRLIIDPSDRGGSGLYLNGLCYSVNTGDPWLMFLELRAYIRKSKELIIEVGRKVFKGCDCNARIMAFINRLITYTRELKKNVWVVNMDYNFLRYENSYLKIWEEKYNLNDTERGAKLWCVLFTASDGFPYKNIDEKHAWGYYWVSKIYPEHLESVYQYSVYKWVISDLACLLCRRWKKEFISKDERCNGGK